MTEEFILVDGVKTPNPDYKKGNQEGELDIDYKTKFSESSKEALRLFEENKAKDAEIARLAELAKGSKKEDEPISTTASLYPGFEDLDQEAQENILKFTGAIEARAEKKVMDKVNSDPALAFARETYNKNKWNSSFDKVLQNPLFADLKEVQEDFRAKYFNPKNVPENIEQILTELAKSFLFDKAKAIGAKEEQEKSQRLDDERQKGGIKTPTAGRTLEEWQKLQQENPAEFARQSKQFYEDLKTGKLKE